MNKLKLLLYMIKHGQLSIRKLLNFTNNIIRMFFNNPKLSGYPSALQIDPTNFCNLNCLVCRNKDIKNKGFMKFEDFKKLIDELSPYLMHVTLYNWGEPFLNKDIYKMIAYLRNKKIFTRLSTNASLPLKPELLCADEIILCLDGANEETYLKFRRGGNFNLVIKNIKELVKYKHQHKNSYPHIVMQFIVTTENENELPTIRKMSTDFGVDELRIKSVGFSEEKYLQYVPKSHKRVTYTNKSAFIKKNGKMKNKCARLWHTAVINWDGSILPCCGDFNSTYQFGNINDGFNNVWNNNKCINFRKTILSDRYKISMCRSCEGKLFDTK